MREPAPWEADACPDEQRAVAALLQAAAAIDGGRRQRILADARALVRRARLAARKAGAVDALLQEFGLGDAEGLALMCLAESLLRIPDGDTADRLIGEKVRAGDWGRHLAWPKTLSVNATALGMRISHGFVRGEAGGPESLLRRLAARLGEPAVRAAMRKAMRLMSQQYVLGRGIEEARRRGLQAYPAGTCFSFDMLGEGARTRADADRYFARYEQAVLAVAAGNRAAGGRADGVSIKLSALHSRWRSP